MGILTKLYHQSRGATETVGQKPEAVQTIAAEVCVLGAVLVSALGQVCACSSNEKQHPPELGNCYSEGGAGCSSSLSSGGSAAGPAQGAAGGDASARPQGAASGDASGPAQDAATGASQDAAGGDAADESGDDGGPCGTAHNGVATQNPMCVPCIVQQCCVADSRCSSDPVCPSLVSSAFPGPGAPMCQSQTPPASCTNFLDFAMCIATCASCPALTLRDF